MTIQSKIKRSFFAFVLLGVLSFLLVNPVMASTVKQEKSEYYPQSRSYAAYERIPITYGKKFIVYGRMINGTVYIPIGIFCDNMLSCRIDWSDTTRSAAVMASGLSMTVTDKCPYIIVNGRYLYNENRSVVLSNGLLYAPCDILCKALGFTYSFNSLTRYLTIGGSFSPIASGDNFYRSDEVYWLSRIISAESRDEPLIGQIAVGNVVLNRRRSMEYPNTIYGVIFDRKYGVQFTPVANGTVYESPYYLSVIAAKICLEGTDVSEGAIYFFDPAISTSFWISNNCTYLYSVKNHWFYK